MLTEAAWTLRSLVTEAGLEGVDLTTVPEVRVLHVCDDSRTVRPGACFVAVRGVASDGHLYIPQAVAAGAVAIVIERSAAPIGPALIPACTVLQVPDTRVALARLATTFHGVRRRTADGRLRLAGVTGTNGKSTTCYLLQSILKAAGHATALLGTIRYDLVGDTVEAPWTTPPATALAEHLARAVGHGATHAVMETSSHALDQRRCDGLTFSAGVFTNLTGDHLDYHKDAASYLAAKKRLFDLLPRGAAAAVNGEDAASGQIVADTAGDVTRFGFEAPRLDVSARRLQVSTGGSRFELCLRGGSVAVHSPLIGRHNVMNALAAAAVAEAWGVTRQAIAAGLVAVRIVPGRLQRVENGNAERTVLVDYAHTDDALVNVLSVLRPLTPRRLICVFGCGGDRDRTKRPRMAAAVERFADLAVVTSDNPRNEDPDAIIAEVLTGFRRPVGARASSPAASRSGMCHYAAGEDARAPGCCVEVEPDRRAAIGRAISLAQAGDTVLIAGKGHEDYQLIGTRKIHFDDVEVAAEFLGSAAGGGASREGIPAGLGARRDSRTSKRTSGV